MSERIGRGFLVAVFLAFVSRAAGPGNVEAHEHRTALAEPRTGQQFSKPVPMGTSCGNWQSSPYLYTGTCGLRVRFFASTQYTAILSNNHVLGAAGPTICPGTATPFQTLTLQPGTLDIGSIPGDPSLFAVGLVAGFIPLNFTGAENFVDAAVAFTTPALAATTVLGIGEPVQAVTAPVPGMPVIKTGRTSDTTTGTIQSIGTTMLVNYGSGCGTARFARQIVITPGTFSRGGDSGSAILEQASNIPIGLLFAGSATLTLANDIRLVYLSLGVYPDSGVGLTNDTFASRAALQKESEAIATPELRRVDEIRARVEAQFFRIPDVVGVGVGLGDGGRDLALVVYSQAASTSEITRALPRTVDGVPVRVIASGRFYAYDW